MARARPKVVLGGLHPTSMPDEAAEHADAVCIGPAETVWGRFSTTMSRAAAKSSIGGNAKARPRWCRFRAAT